MVPVEFRKVVLLRAHVLRSNLLNRRRLYPGPRADMQFSPLGYSRHTLSKVSMS